MKPAICSVLFSCLLAGCVQTAGRRPEIASPATISPDAPPEHDITALLEYRSRLCAGDSTQRLQWLDQHRDAQDRRTRLRLLLAASCEPRHYATLLHSNAATLQKDYAHNESYHAFFTLIESFSSALTAEQKHLEKTIRGLTDIEEDIGNKDDSPGGKGATK